MTYLSPGDAVVQVPQYVTVPAVAPAPVPFRRTHWLLPLLALLALSAIGAGIGLYLHRMHGITEVEAGQCFTNLEGLTDPDQQTLLSHRVDCAEPHTAEAIAVVNRPSEIHEGSILDWPHVSAIGNTLVGAAADNSLEEWPAETCSYRFNDYLGIPAADSDFTLYPFPMFVNQVSIPDNAALQYALDHNEWKLVCIVGHELRTGSIRNYAR